MKEVLEFRVTDIDDLEKKGISLLPVQDINHEMLKTNQVNEEYLDSISDIYHNINLEIKKNIV